MAKESRGRYLFKNTLIFAMGSVATKLITFILVPFYTFMLTTEQYGVVDLISTICMVISPILLLNISESVLRFSMDKNANYNQIMSIGLLLLLFAAGSGVFIIPLTKVIDGLSGYSGYVYFYILSFAASQLFLCYLRGREKLVLYTYGSILNTLGIAVLNIIFLKVLQEGIKGFLKAYIWANIITVIYSFCAGNVREVIKKFQINRILMFEMLRYSIFLIPNVFMWWIMNSADRLIVAAVMGTAANGIFAIAYKIPSLMVTAAAIFNQAWSYSAVRENESSDRNSYVNEVYKGMFMFVALSALGMMMVLKPFLRIYVNEEYYVAWKYTPYLIIGFVFQALGTFLATPYTVNKDSRGYLVSSVCGAAANITLNALLIFKMGLKGVAIATCIGYLIVFLYRVYDTRKYAQIDVFQANYLVMFVLIGIQAAAMYCSSQWGNLIRIALFVTGIALQYSVWKPMAVRILKKKDGK